MEGAFVTTGIEFIVLELEQDFMDVATVFF